MYEDLTDEELAAKIIELRGKIETVAGGGIIVLAGEGRRKEISKGNVGDLQALYDAAVAERDRRRNGGRRKGRAIGVRYGR